MNCEPAVDPGLTLSVNILKFCLSENQLAESAKPALSIVAICLRFYDLREALLSRTQFRPDFVPVATDTGVDALCIQSRANRISHLTGF